MKATQIIKSRTVLDENSFIDMAVWHLPEPVLGSEHPFKYRLALVVGGECVMRYDNERGKGDHKHINGLEVKTTFTTLEKLLDDFVSDVERTLK